MAVSDVDQGREVESSERKRIFKGYYASTSIRLSLTDFKLVHRVQSEVLADDLIEVKWMNQVSDHEGELRQKALADAARVALKKAEILAGTLGAKIGDVLEITETSFDRETGYGNYSSNFVQTQSMVDLGGPQEAQVSEISVRAAVNVKFELIK